MDGSAAVDGGSAAVDVDAPTKKSDKKAAHLQRAVDPQLLVSSKSKGPPRHRDFPTKKVPKAMKVCLHDTACAWHEVPDLFHSHLLARQQGASSQPLRLEKVAKAGAKRARSTSPSSARETRSIQRR